MLASALRTAALTTLFVLTCVIRADHPVAESWRVDESFAPELRRDDEVTRGVVAVPDGRGGFYVIGGLERNQFATSPEVPTGPFTHINGAPHANLVHLLPDGSVDPAFVFELPAGRELSARDIQNKLVVIRDGGFWVVFFHLDESAEPEADGRRWEIHRFQADGSRDPDLPPIVTDGLTRIAAHPGGGVVAWGDFETVAGQTRVDLARIDAAGHLTAFTSPWLPNDLWINSAAVTPSGDVLVTGQLNAGDDRWNHRILRVSPSGVSDPDFAANTAAAFPGWHEIGAVLPDGRFFTIQSEAHRAHPDGTPDESWSPDWNYDLGVQQTIPLTDGRVIIVGRNEVEVRSAAGSRLERLAEVSGTAARAHLLASDDLGNALVLQGELATFLHFGWEIIDFPADRLIDARLARWSIDSGNLTELEHRFIARGVPSVDRLIIDHAGRIAVAGDFTHIDGEPRPGIARLLSDGTLDSSFSPTGDLGPVRALDDGTWIARERFYESQADSIVRQTVNRPVRLLEDGSIDPGFRPPAEVVLSPAGYVSMRSRWWGQRADGALLMSAPSVDPEHATDVAFAWIDATTGDVLERLPATFPMLSFEGIPRIQNIDPIIGAACSPAGRVIVVWTDHALSLFPTSEAVIAVFDTAGNPDSSLDDALANHRVASWNPPAFNPSGDALFTLVDDFNEVRHLFVRGDGSIEWWPADQDYLYLPGPIGTTGWHGAQSLTDQQGRIDPRWHPSFLAPNGLPAITTMARDTRGRLWIGGRFYSVDDRPRNGLVRMIDTRSNTRLINFSALAQTSPRAPQVLGFVVGGEDATSPPLLLRAVGQGLAPYLPAETTALVTEPELVLLNHSLGSQIRRSGHLEDAEILAADAAVGAFPALPAESERVPGVTYGSAWLGPLPRGNFTLLVSPADDTTGISLAEIYDTNVNAGPEVSPLRNVSIRAQITAGSPVLTAGFVIAGDGLAPLLIRGIGPGLSDYSVPSPVADPRIKLIHSHITLQENDDSAAYPALEAATATAGAFPLAAGSQDAAMLVQLPPGAYTVQLTSSADDPGEALLEIYLIEPWP